MIRDAPAAPKADLDQLLYDEWRWQLGLFRRLLKEIDTEPKVGSYGPAAQHTWDRLEALAEACKGVHANPFWPKSV